jgi:hypothetical protein
MKNIILFCLLAVMTVACGSKSTKDMLVGEWQLTAVSGEELSEKEKATVINFKADGNATNTRVEGEVKKWDVKSKDEKEYLILGESEFEIKSCDGKKLIFIDRDDEITLSKK